MRISLNVLASLLLAGLASVVMGPSAVAAPIHAHSNAQRAFSQFLRVGLTPSQRQGIRLQEQQNLGAARASERSQLRDLQLARRTGQISAAVFRTERALLLQAAQQANRELIGLIRQENNLLHEASRQASAGQISPAQYAAEVNSIVSSSQAQQISLIHRIQNGLLPATPSS